MKLIKCDSTDEIISHAKRLNIEDKINNNEISCSICVYDSNGNTVEMYIFYYNNNNFMPVNGKPCCRF